VAVAIAELVRLYERGLTLAEVGLEVGMSHSAVHKRLKAAGVSTRRRGAPPELEERIREMYRQGRKRRDIETETGAGRGAVQRALAGESAPKAARSASGWPQHRIEEAGRLYESGKTIAEVAQLLDCAGDTARGLILRSGRRLRTAQEAAQLRAKNNPSTRPTLGEGVTEERREELMSEPISIYCGRCLWSATGTMAELEGAHGRHECRPLP
jgi:hypothetical protein